MKKLLPHSLLLASLALTTSAFADITVTNGNNSGPGSLRAALASGSNIVIDDSVRTIKVTETLHYNGKQQLHLYGSGGQIIDASSMRGDGDILSINQGPNVVIHDLNFVGNAKGSNRNSSKKVGGKGIFVSIPLSAKGTAEVILKSVAVSNVGDHAVHVSDCSLRNNCGGGSNGGGHGSDASVLVDFDEVIINRVGFGLQDGDGVRIDERGEGHITFNVKSSRFLNVGADGIELDEGGNGNININMSKSTFHGNGGYCGSIPFVSGSLCDNEGSPDLDDAFDVDESGQGSIYATITNSNFKHNFDEGLDFDELGDGNVVMNITNCAMSHNTDEGIKVSEGGAGNIVSNLTNITLENNNSHKEGIQMSEEDDGDLSVVITGSNAVGSEDVKLEQGQAGAGTVKLVDSTVSLDLEQCRLIN